MYPFILYGLILVIVVLAVVVLILALQTRHCKTRVARSGARASSSSLTNVRLPRPRTRLYGPLPQISILDKPYRLFMTPNHSTKQNYNMSVVTLQDISEDHSGSEQYVYLADVDSNGNVDFTCPFFTTPSPGIVNAISVVNVFSFGGMMIAYGHEENSNVASLPTLTKWANAAYDANQHLDASGYGLGNIPSSEPWGIWYMINSCKTKDSPLTSLGTLPNGTMFVDAFPSQPYQIPNFEPNNQVFLMVGTTVASMDTSTCSTDSNPIPVWDGKCIKNEPWLELHTPATLIGQRVGLTFGGVLPGFYPLKVQVAWGQVLVFGRQNLEETGLVGDHPGVVVVLSMVQGADGSVTGITMHPITGVINDHMKSITCSWLDAQMMFPQNKPAVNSVILTYATCTTAPTSCASIPGSSEYRSCKSGPGSPDDVSYTTVMWNLNAPNDPITSSINPVSYVKPGSSGECVFPMFSQTLMLNDGSPAAVFIGAGGVKLVGSRNTSVIQFESLGTEIVPMETRPFMPANDPGWQYFQAPSSLFPNMVWTTCNTPSPSTSRQIFKFVYGKQSFQRQWILKFGDRYLTIGNPLEDRDGINTQLYFMAGGSRIPLVETAVASLALSATRDEASVYFDPTGNPDKYYIRHAGSGWYLAPCYLTWTNDDGGDTRCTNLFMWSFQPGGAAEVTIVGPQVNGGQVNLTFSFENGKSCGGGTNNQVNFLLATGGITGHAADGRSSLLSPFLWYQPGPQTYPQVELIFVCDTKAGKCVNGLSTQ